jgi:hypothetical protein
VGARKPVWFVFDAWNRTSGNRLAVDGDDALSGLWARASTDGGGLDVLLVSWDARGGSDRKVAVHLPGGCGEVRRIDSTSPSFDAASAVDNIDGAITLDVPAQSVTWLSVSPECAGLTARRGGPQLPATGHEEHELIAMGTAMLLLALVARRIAVRPA